jgi:hypothetical protein
MRFRLSETARRAATTATTGHNLRVCFATADAAAAFEAVVQALPAATGFVVSTDEVCKVVYNWDVYNWDGGGGVAAVGR